MRKLYPFTEDAWRNMYIIRYGPVIGPKKYIERTIKDFIFECSKRDKRTFGKKPVSN